ncbi:MAG TPA: AAA family ATPase [Acidiphilium sp.]|nr:AAA family ATPase [Acidiphilium sp.]
MTFSFKPATRDKIGLLFSLAGASGSGKTLSALRLAKGIANGSGKIAVIDTEAGRAKHYADKFDFLHCDFEPPFTPERYVEAIKAAEEAGATVIVIDSMSHEWNGEGGCADMQAMEAERMATGKDGKVVAWKIEAMTAPAWKKPKIRHKRMVSRLLQCRSHLIFCLRAEEKVKFVKETIDGRERTSIVPQGFMPVCEKGFMFEMSGSLTLHPETPGLPRTDMTHKLNDELRAIFRDSAPITEDHGVALRGWAERGGSERPTLDRVSEGARAILERIEDAEDQAAYHAIDADPAVRKQRDYLRANRPDLSERIEAAISEAYQRFFTPVEEGEAA